MPAGLEPHPVALLAHGVAASEETLFRYAEALAAAGFMRFYRTFTRGVRWVDHEVSGIGNVVECKPIDGLVSPHLQDAVAPSSRVARF